MQYPVRSFKFLARCLVWLGVACVGLAVAPVQAQTYAYRNDVFAYDTPTAAAASLPWHASGASPACTGYPQGDDDWSDIVFPGGFTFTFGGTSYSSVRVYSNGMLAFPTDVSGFHRDYTPQALPITTVSNPGPTAPCTLSAVPKNLMVVYWNDIIAGTANGVAGASVKYEVLGVAPSRRLVVSWDNVSLYSSNGTTRYSFQVALFESTAGVNGNFRYQYTNGASDGSGATVGVQLTTTDFTQYSYNQQFIDTTNGTAITWYPANQLAAKSAEYRFDEAAWTGVAGEIKDTSGNSQNASRVGAAASVPYNTFPGGKLCRGGSFTSNTSNATIDAVATPIVPGNQGSIDFWFNSNVKWNSAAAMLFDATSATNRPFFLMKSATGALTFVVSDSVGTKVTATAPAKTYALNTWHHVGVAWNVRVGTNQTDLQIFLDGVLQNGVPTRGTTNGLMPALGTVYIGDNRTSGITPSGGTPNGANGSIDEVYIYPVEISAPQALADMSLTRANCTVLDHFHIMHDGAVSSCTSPASITIEAHDSTHTLFSLAGTSMNLSTTPAHGTWSNIPGGAINSLTAIGVGTGTASYTFAGESSVTFGLSDNLTEALNVNVASGAITEHTGTAASCVASDYTNANPGTTTCDDSRSFVCAAVPFGFNCVESGGANPLTGHLYTKLAGTAFNFNVVALKDTNNNGIADAVETSYASDADKTVTVELVDGSGATACASRTAINPAISPVSSQTLIFTKANQPTEQGRKQTADMTVTKAYPNLRCRITDANQAPSIVSCSTDNFAVRPGAITLSTIPVMATPPSATSAGTIKAGTNFTLRAATSTAATDGYASTLSQDATKLTAQTPTQDTSQATGGVVGTLSPATVTGNATPTNNASYSEVGYLYLAPGAYRDDTFTAVDSAAGDCVTSTASDANLSDALASGQYGCSIGNKTAVSMGRFIPDHFAVANPVLTQGCVAGGFTYMNQPFGLTANIVAQSSSNTTTQNYGGVFAKGVVTTQAENGNNGTALGSRVSFAAPWSNGIAAYSATQFARPITTTWDATWGPYDALAIGATVSDGDGVLLINRDMDQSNAACTADSAGTSNGTCPAVTLASGAKQRFGRLRMENAYGSELLALNVPIYAQYWNGRSFDRNVLDTCTSLAVANVNLVNYQGGITATNMGLSHVTAVAAFAAGASSVSLSRPSPTPTAMGSMDIIINLGSAGAAMICPPATAATLGTSAALPFLSGKWCAATAYDRDPSSRATFGVFKSPLIYRRENY